VVKSKVRKYQAAWVHMCGVSCQKRLGPEKGGLPIFLKQRNFKCLRIEKGGNWAITVQEAGGNLII